MLSFIVKFIISCVFVHGVQVQIGNDFREGKARHRVVSVDEVQICVQSNGPALKSYGCPDSLGSWRTLSGDAINCKEKTVCSNGPASNMCRHNRCTAMYVSKANFGFTTFTEVSVCSLWYALCCWLPFGSPTKPSVIKPVTDCGRGPRLGLTSGMTHHRCRQYRAESNGIWTRSQYDNVYWRTVGIMTGSARKNTTWGPGL